MNYAIILAGGTGSRMDHYLPKQFLELYNKPIIIYTLEKFKQNHHVDKILIVIHPEWRTFLKKVLTKFDFSDCWITEGGKSRKESSYNGLLFLQKKKIKKDDIVIIHDAVRPFVNEKIINEGIRAAKQYGAVDVVVKTVDTIVQVNKKGFIKNFPIREELYNGQTPQIFKFEVILKAHKKALQKEIPNVTDDCKLVLESGHKVKIIEGDYENIKITTMADLKLAKKIIEEKQLHEK